MLVNRLTINPFVTVHITKSNIENSDLTITLIKMTIEVDKIIKNPKESNFQPSEFKPDHNENSMEEE